MRDMTLQQEQRISWLARGREGRWSTFRMSARKTKPAVSFNRHTTPLQQSILCVPQRRCVVFAVRENVVPSKPESTTQNVCKRRGNDVNNK
jgi:hypothetical protein